MQIYMPKISERRTNFIFYFYFIIKRYYESFFYVFYPLDEVDVVLTIDGLKLLLFFLALKVLHLRQMRDIVLELLKLL